MKKEHQDLITWSAANYKKNRKISQKLGKLKPQALDEQIHDLHEEVFQNIDCLECANCCSTTSPIFKSRDIDRLAKALRVKPGDFIEQYLRVDEDQDYVLKSSPCPFLGEDNYCSVYNDRPGACREYPHTNRKKMFQIMNLTLKNTKVCPAVAKIFQHLH